MGAQGWRVNSDNLVPLGTEAFSRIPLRAPEPPRLRLVGAAPNPWGVGKGTRRPSVPAPDRGSGGLHIHLHVGDATAIRRFGLALAGQIDDAGDMGEPVRSPAPRTVAEELVTPQRAPAVALEATLELWREQQEADHLDAKYIKQQHRAVRLLVESAGVDDLAEITRPMVLAHRNELCKQFQSGSTVNNRLAAIRKFFEWALKFEILKDNPSRELDNAARNDGDGNREFTPEEAARMIDVARADEASEKPQHGAIRSPAYILAWNTGLRHIELSRLWKEDVRGLGTADAFLELHWTKTKNRRAVQIPLNHEAQAELAKWLPLIEHPRDNIFPTKYTPGVPQLPHERVVDRDIAAAGILKRDEWDAPVGFHSFRKGGATALAAAGRPLDEVSRFMRHSDPRLTQKVYVRLRRGQMGQVNAAIPQIGRLSDSAKSAESAPGSEAISVDKGGRRSDSTTSQAAMRTTQANPGISAPGAISAPLPENSGQSRPGPKGRISPSDSRRSSVLPTPAIAGVGFESAPAVGVAGTTITVNLTISPEAAGAFVRALAGLLGGGQSSESSSVRRPA